MKFLLDIVSTPAILVALIAVIGLILQKKSLPDIMKGGIKTFVGFLVVSGGAGIIQNSLNPFGKMFEHAFNFLNRSPYALYGVYDCCYLVGCWIYESSINHTWRISARNHHECFSSLCSKIYGAINRK